MMKIGVITAQLMNIFSMFFAGRVGVLTVKRLYGKKLEMSSGD